MGPDRREWLLLGSTKSGWSLDTAGNLGTSELELPAERQKGEQDKPTYHTHSICVGGSQKAPSLFYTV